MLLTETEIERLIENATVSIISSIDKMGFPNSKAMLPPRRRIGLREFYFTTNWSSKRVDQYLKNDKASIYFFNEINFQGIMITGRMEVLEDQDSKKEIWREGDIIYYPDGINDKDYCVLKFVGEKIRNYSNFQKEEYLLRA